MLQFLKYIIKCQNWSILNFLFTFQNFNHRSYKEIAWFYYLFVLSFWILSWWLKIFKFSSKFFKFCSTSAVLRISAQVKHKLFLNSYCYINMVFLWYWKWTGVCLQDLRCSGIWAVFISHIWHIFSKSLHH